MKLLKIKTARFSQIIESCGKPEDFGIVGFKESREARYLIFPKSLKRVAEKRIIGIDWALVRE